MTKSLHYRPLKGGDSSERPLLDAATAIAVVPSPFDAKTVGYTPRLLASASLPYRKPTPRTWDQKTERWVGDLDEFGAWVRTNGSARLVVQQGANRLGIPYGMFPRVFLIWLTTQIFHERQRRKREKDYRLSFGHCFADFARTLKVDRSRGENGSGKALIEQVARVLDAQFAFGATTGDETAGALHAKNLDVADDYSLFWSTKRNGADQASLFESWVDIDEKFFNEITTQYFPLDMRVVDAIRKRRAPMELDIYQWMSYRLFGVTKNGRASMVTWPQIAAQFPGDYARPRRFREHFADGLNRVLAIHQSANVTITETGVLMKPSPIFIPEKLIE